MFNVDVSSWRQSSPAGAQCIQRRSPPGVTGDMRQEPAPMPHSSLKRLSTLSKTPRLDSAGIHGSSCERHFAPAAAHWSGPDAVMMKRRVRVMLGYVSLTSSGRVYDDHHLG
ncbi:hypothetical protein CFE70_003998 [Pyrenophora teres f. teres 0-1]